MRKNRIGLHMMTRGLGVAGGISLRLGNGLWVLAYSLVPMLDLGLQQQFLDVA